MWKKLGLIILVLALISVFTIPSAEAGSKSILKALALGGLFAALPPPPVVISPAPEHHYRPPRQEYVPGHWEMTREWVPGPWERVWIPGHYDRWGNRVAGHYEDRQAPGFYEERRVLGRRILQTLLNGSTLSGRGFDPAPSGCCRIYKTRPLLITIPFLYLSLFKGT